MRKITCRADDNILGIVIGMGVADSRAGQCIGKAGPVRMATKCFSGTLADMHRTPEAAMHGYNKATHDQSRPEGLAPKFGLVMCGVLFNQEYFFVIFSQY